MPRTLKRDVWSLGCTFVQLLTGEHLFPSNNKTVYLHMVNATLGGMHPSVWAAHPKRQKAVARWEASWRPPAWGQGLAPMPAAVFC